MNKRTMFVGLLAVCLVLFLIGNLTALAQDKPADNRTANNSVCCQKAQANPNCCTQGDKTKTKCDPASCDSTKCTMSQCSHTDTKCAQTTNCNPDKAGCKRTCTGR